MKKEVLKENIRPYDKDIVKVKEMGNITEVLYSEHRKTWCSILKINKNEYMEYNTGEIKEFQHIANRAEDMNNVRVSLGNLRDIINTNVIEASCCRWVTLTYAENMTDTKQLYEDYKKFIMRLRYKYGEFEYIVAMEPQGRGAWHCHSIFIFKATAPFIPNQELAEIWSHGFVTIKKLENIDNVGAYFTAYLGDMELPENSDMVINENQIKEVEVEDNAGNKIKKKFIKGARLYLYPPGFNLYRISRGIKQPDVNYMQECEARKKVSAVTLTFERTIKLSDEDKEFENTLNYRYYNKLRNKCQ